MLRLIGTFNIFSHQQNADLRQTESEDKKMTNSDMYEFGGIIKDALDKVAVPTVKTALKQSMSHMSTYEVYNYVDGILRGFDFYKEGMVQNTDPVGGINDFTALWFLLFPFKKNSGYGDSVFEDLEGAADRYLVPRYALNDKQRFCLTYLRRIRNVATHNDGKQKLTERNPELDTEKGALEFIAMALHPFDANIADKMREYHTELEQKIKRSNASAGSTDAYDQQKQQRLNTFVNKIALDRREYAYHKTREYPCMAAPIGKPLEGRAPWMIRGLLDRELIWPSSMLDRAQKELQNKQEEIKKKFGVQNNGKGFFKSLW